MARKSGRKSRKAAVHRGGASACTLTSKKRMRRRHKFKSQSHRFVLLKNYFFNPETMADDSQKKSDPVYRFCADIPESYNESYIRTLPIDPESVFAYWEIIPENQTEKNDKTDNTEIDKKLIIRLKKRSSAAEEVLERSERVLCSQLTTDIDCKVEGKAAGDLVIRIPEAGESYTLEIIHSTDTGKESLIASSDTIKGFSSGSELFFNSICELSDYDGCFDDSEEVIREKTAEPMPDKICKSEYNRYLGSASL